MWSIHEFIKLSDRSILVMLFNTATEANPMTRRGKVENVNKKNIVKPDSHTICENCLS